jgi:hypothetical protein
MRTWERHDPDPTRPVAAPLDRCAELLGVELATVREAAATVEPYLRADVTKQGRGAHGAGASAPERSAPPVSLSGGAPISQDEERTGAGMCFGVDKPWF